MGETPQPPQWAVDGSSARHWGRSDDPMNDEDDPGRFRHRFTQVNDIRLHYVEQGDGPLVLLLHGYPFLWYIWRHQIGSLAAGGFRVVALDQRGYGQSDCPPDVGSYDVTHLVGDVVGLMRALSAEPAVLVGQDWGSPVAYYTALMRPELVRGIVMMCSPPDARGPMPPSKAMEGFKKNGLDFYQSYLAQPEAGEEIMADLRRFLLGVFYSTSGYCPPDQQWRWAWKASEAFSATYTVPPTLPPHLSQQALDYYFAQFSHTGIQPANKWYAAVDSSWENTSFLDGATVRQPAIFIGGDQDPSAKPLFGVDRQRHALSSLRTNFPDLRDVVTLPGVGHSPPEERPEDVNGIILEFLKDIGFGP